MVFTLDEKFDTVAKMKVIGVGGAGGNAVNRMIEEGLTGVDFISVNTDAMALDNNKAPQRVQIGERITRGLGAGANPEIGRIAMEEDRDKIKELLDGSDMVFITAGMGGGTGTGGAAVVAEISKELDILTVAIVTRPFLFEGKIRDRNARNGIEELRNTVDTIIVIQNQKLLSVVDRNTPLMEAFRTADNVLHNATKGISDLISVHGLVNLDFADVKTIMKCSGDAIMGSGFGEGENRAAEAADAAIHSPMLDDVSIAGAKGILINVTGGDDLTLYDVGDATQAIYDAVGEDSDTNIIFGAVTDPAMNNRVQVTVIATGFNDINGSSNTPDMSAGVGRQGGGQTSGQRKFGLGGLNPGMGNIPTPKPATTFTPQSSYSMDGGAYTQSNPAASQQQRFQDGNHQYQGMGRNTHSVNEQQPMRNVPFNGSQVPPQYEQQQTGDPMMGQQPQQQQPMFTEQPMHPQQQPYPHAQQGNVAGNAGYNSPNQYNEAGKISKPDDLEVVKNSKAYPRENGGYKTKGSHPYDVDMDVPTFLRKQMQ